MRLRLLDDSGSILFYVCAVSRLTFGQGLAKGHDGRHVAVNWGVRVRDGGLWFRESLSDHAAHVGGRDLGESALGREGERERGKP